MRYHPRVRLVFLGVVNAVILFHIFVFYVLDQREIGCVDFFGLATFAGKGQITAGTIFLAGLMVVTLVLGRVFCGWGCHFALFQDLLTRAFARLGVRAPFRHSRLELIVPALLLFVTLLYPILVWWRDAGVPTSTTMNLAYPDVWHLLPGAKGVILILLVDVVVLSLLFGGRAFCRYLCPYGLFLKPLHAISPTRVVKVGDCSGCGSCTRGCPTGVPIKYEVETFGVVRDLNCMNCGDCIALCPAEALSLRPTKRAYFRWSGRVAYRVPHPRWVDLTLLVGSLLGLVAYRGRDFGDFLSAGLGLVAAAMIVIAFRPHTLFGPRVNNALSAETLRRTAALVGVLLVLGIVGQAVGKYAMWRGERAIAEHDYARLEHVYATALPIARLLRPATFYLDDFVDHTDALGDRVHREADLLLLNGRYSDAIYAYRAVLVVQPDRVSTYGNLGTAQFKSGDYFGAAASYLRVLQTDPDDLVGLYHMAMTHIQLRQHDEAIAMVRRVLDIDTGGSAYELIRENPLFQLLNGYPEYRRGMAAYSVARGSNSEGTKKGDTP